MKARRESWRCLRNGCESACVDRGRQFDEPASVTRYAEPLGSETDSGGQRQTALQAMEIAKSTGHPFPLVLLDGQMPEMDGLLWRRRFRRSGAGGATIMMLTSAGHLETRTLPEAGISGT